MLLYGELTERKAYASLYLHCQISARLFSESTLFPVCITFVQFAFVQCVYVREDITKNKNVFFRALPEFPKPPPHDPNSGNLVLLFGRQNSRFESHLWGGKGDILTT